MQKYILRVFRKMSALRIKKAIKKDLADSRILNKSINLVTEDNIKKESIRLMAMIRAKNNCKTEK